MSEGQQSLGHGCRLQTRDPTAPSSASDIRCRCIRSPSPSPQAHPRLQYLVGTTPLNCSTPTALAQLSGHRHLMYLELHTAVPSPAPLALRDMPRLVFLDLSGCRIAALPTDPGVWASFPVLQELVLRRTPVAALPPALAAAPRLRSVDIALTPACAAPGAIPPALAPRVQCFARPPPPDVACAAALQRTFPRSCGSCAAQFGADEV